MWRSSSTRAIVGPALVVPPSVLPQTDRSTICLGKAGHYNLLVGRFTQRLGTKRCDRTTSVLPQTDRSTICLGKAGHYNLLLRRFTQRLETKRCDRTTSARAAA